MRTRRGKPTPALIIVTSWAETRPSAWLLGQAEQSHADTLPPWRRRQWTAARLTARAALLLVHGRPPHGLEILPAADGAPRILGAAATTWWVSLSHSGDWAACAVSPLGRPMGVDIEHDDACDLELLARVSAPDELPPVPRSATSRWATSRWARKEAAFKACRGVPAALSCYRVGGDGSIVAGQPGATRPRQLTSWETNVPGAVLAVAGQPGPAPAVRVLAGSAVLAFLGKARRGQERRARPRPEPTFP
ncbi:MAG TPA: 4'-phosphopantetheinyl transferase superfamily protein [Pseudonocardiaceae bacterium]|jgi:phosphopantetheinyl transferase|nr:4'-phosphopantetheinyl transferase superfamily protein [Pseudonocardiaceae bacterium]